MAASDSDSDTILAGKYRLQEAIGVGGMGSVWRAEHTLLHRAVAVKLIELRGGDPMLAERFLREARVAAKVRHPNVVDIIDFGQTEAGQPFMVMELLEGESLLHRMIDDRPPLSTQQIVHVMVQVLMGLDAVHRAGIIHRDLKPGNIFLSYDDDGSIFARLLDFGISYSIDPESQLRRGQFGTDERIITGTPEYMSPEQAEGRPDVDVRADVYAVGVILYELLAHGQLPYADPNPGGVLFKVMTGVHRPLVELRPDIPELCEVVEGALQHDREKRPATARELRRQLMSAIGLGPDTSGLHFRIEQTGERDLRHTPRNTPRPMSEQPTLDGLKPSRPSLSAPALRPRWPIAAGLAAAAVAVGLGVWAATRSATPTPGPAPTPAVVVPPAPPVPAVASTPLPAEPAPTAPPVAGAAASEEAAATPPTPGTRRRARHDHEAAPEAPDEPAAPTAPEAREPTAPAAPAAPRPHEIVRELDF